MISLALSFVLVSITALSSAVTHPPAPLFQAPSPTRRQFQFPLNASHVLPVNRGLQQRVHNRLFVEEGDNESGRMVPLPSHRLPESSRVVIYIACSCLLTGLVLAFTLVTAYGGRRGSHLGRPVSSASWAQFAESYPLLDRSPLRIGQDSPVTQRLGSSDEDDENEPVVAEKNEDVLDCTTAVKREIGERASSFAGCSPSEISEGPWSTTWSFTGEPPQVIIKSKPSVKRPIEVFPGRLLDLCNQDAPLTFHALLPSGKLSALKHGMAYRAPNFIEVERIVCVFDQFPEWLLRSGNQGLDSSNESLAESLASEMARTEGSSDASDLFAAFRPWKGAYQCCLTRHFIVFELCYAGKPLSRISLRSAVQGRSLVQQAACCVAVAERALGFRHTGVDADKLLVAVTDEASLEYRLPDRTTPISIESAGLKAHLAGCLSFDIDSAGTGSGTPRFYGNVMWLGAVMDSMVNKLRSEVPESRARAERADFEELLSWQAQLQQCNSADEFVATLGL
ncbi:hypothetical protein HPB52_001931 [Rhipicephalus sanguineus]|uniref:Protein kinase domain-containing protein n=1 Tax=Rhipicephalus sanguineus TaxID=34632 RepID=A0A9D4PPU9_RHISA|nr:hypothetical protein HPB52_001931 [Rhipicephalus sanguineus]